jgi:hypothetical protein
MLFSEDGLFGDQALAIVVENKLTYCLSDDIEELITIYSCTLKQSLQLCRGRVVLPSPHLLASFMSCIEVIHPFLIKWRQWPARCALSRLPCELPKLFKINFEVWINNGKSRSIASDCDSISLPRLLLFNRRKSGPTCENTCCSNSLPFKDLEGKPSADLDTHFESVSSSQIIMEFL